MATSIPETFRIADLVQWHKEKTLVVNEDFQRRSVWTPGAKTYLIDTVLRRLPVPSIYMRTIINRKTQRAYREIVDGQQRLRAFVEFASNKFKLGKTAKEFSGKTYEDLEPELQDAFLEYPITTVQLINASDADVLEVFGRLNAYNVSLNAAELRHARYQGDFKWAITEASKRWSVLWDKHHIVSIRERVRMMDDALMAEMFGILLEGVDDGGEHRINQLYEIYDKKDPTAWNQETTLRRLDTTLQFADQKLEAALIGHLATRPQFLMLFAALAHSLVGISPGKLGKLLPVRDPLALSDITTVVSNLRTLNNVLGADEPEPGFEEFWLASRATTHRIASRSVRFHTYWKALLPVPL